MDKKNSAEVFAHRYDLVAIDKLLPPGARILDLGCGDGLFLKYLAETKSIESLGIEIDQDRIIQCIANGDSKTLQTKVKSNNYTFYHACPASSPHASRVAASIPKSCSVFSYRSSTGVSKIMVSSAGAMSQPLTASSSSNCPSLHPE